MRITKKFTGACCLGRRAYHLRDRPQASPAELEMARLDLLHLEQRFRLRVEHEQSGLMLPPRHEILPAQTAPPMAAFPSFFPSLHQTHGAPAANSNPWMANNNGAPGFMAPPPVPSTATNNLLHGGGANNMQFPNVAGLSGLTNHNSSLPFQVGQLLFQGSNERIQPSSHGPAPAAAQLQSLNTLVASLALAQAASKLNQQQQQRIGASTPMLSLPAQGGNFVNPHGSSDDKTAPATSRPLTHDFQYPLLIQQLQQPEKTKAITNTTPPPPLSAKEKHARELKAAFEEQQKALRLAYEKTLRENEEQEVKSSSGATSEGAIKESALSRDENITSATTCKDPGSTSISPAEQLQRSYEAHLASLQRAEQKGSLNPSQLSKLVDTKEKNKEAEPRKMEGSPDEEAGTILLGFYNSLRKSFEDAVGDGHSKTETTTAVSEKKKKPKKKRNKNRENTDAASKVKAPAGHSTLSKSGTKKHKASSPFHRQGKRSRDSSSQSSESPRQESNPITSLSRFQKAKRKIKPASVTESSSGTSSQPTTEQSSSSLDDSDSKSDKSERSTSDDSDKAVIRSHASQGPPRKRLKGYHELNEMTRENLLEHSKRMEGRDTRHGPAGNS